MSTAAVFIYTGALLPDGRIYVKVNMKDAARARDTFMVLSESDELFDEAVTHVISYATLQADGKMEVKARVCDSDNPALLDASTRTKLHLDETSVLYKKLLKLLGPMTVGKQVWLD